MPFTGPRVSTGVLFATLALLGSCSSPICGCTPADLYFGHAVLRGHITDSLGNPLGGIRIDVVGAMFTTHPSPAFASSAGDFSFTVFDAAGAGPRELDLIFTPAGLPADTLANVPVTFRMREEPPDTVVVNHSVSE